MATETKDGVLGRTLDAVIAAMPPESQARIAERTAQLQAEAEAATVARDNS